MSPTLDRARARWNGARIDETSPRGGYESWFCRANHPSRPLAFWIRYTRFVPRGWTDGALGELWAMHFDGEHGRVVAVREEHPAAACRFARDGLDVRIAEASLGPASLEGSASHRARTIGWSLRYTADAPPLLLLPERLYEGPFPKAKALVAAPMARFDGWLDVDGTRIEVDGWTGSQNHNWGSEHTARYAWGQVAGFDNAPEAFLEVSSARVRVGPMLLPTMTVLVLRLDGEELRMSSVLRALRAQGRYAPFEWTFATGDGAMRIDGRIAAPAHSFVALPYLDTHGPIKTCLNSKLASCELTVTRRGRAVRVLRTSYRAAFEMVGDEPPPAGVVRLSDT